MIIESEKLGNNICHQNIEMTNRDYECFMKRAKKMEDKTFTDERIGL